MQTLDFLSLPDELIVQIFCHLDFPVGLKAALTLNRRSRYIISNSVLLQYIILLRRLGVIDNPASPLPLSQRYELLRQREEAWLTFHIKRRTTIQLPNRPDGIYDLTGGHYFAGDLSRTAVNFVQLPRCGLTETNEPEWNQVKHSHTHCDIGVSVYEHDLVVVVHQLPLATLNLGVEFIQLSTGLPHPEARRPIMSLPRISPPLFTHSGNAKLHVSVYIEVVGKFCIVQMGRARHLALVDTGDRFFVIDWMAGVVVKQWLNQGYHYQGFVMLSRDTILVPNIHSHSLEVWELPTHLTEATAEPEPCPPDPALILELAPLHDGVSVIGVVARSEPNPMTRTFPGSRASKLPFYIDPESAVILLYVHFQNNQGLHCKLAMFTTRRAIHGIHQKSPGTVVWKDWGPSSVLFVDVTDETTRWMTTSCGQRAAFISEAADTEPSRITIIDFNRNNIPFHRDRLLSFMQANPHCVGRGSGGTIFVTFPNDVSVIESLPAGSKFEDEHQLFKGEVSSDMECVKYDSGNLGPSQFSCGGILMEEDSLVGIQTDETNQTKALEFFTFV